MSVGFINSAHSHARVTHSQFDVHISLSTYKLRALYVLTIMTATAMVVPLFQCAVSFPDGFDHLGTIHLRSCQILKT